MADPGYRLVFDLAAQGANPWPGLWTLVAVGAVAFILFVIGAARIVRGFTHTDAPRAGRTAWFLTVFVGVIAAAFLFGGFHQMARENALHEAVRSGQVRTVSGCLDYFIAEDSSSMRGTTLDERWSVAGRRFSYSGGDMGSAFHRIERKGGPVHADSRVRVSFVPDRFTGGVNIVRLEVRDRACPRAPEPGDSGPLTSPL